MILKNDEKLIRILISIYNFIKIYKNKIKSRIKLIQISYFGPGSKPDQRYPGN